MERATRIGGLYLRADDPARLCRWYADHLGVETASEPADPTPGVSMFTAMPADANATSLEVHDLDAMVSQLRDAGIDVNIDPTRYHDGRFASLRDPEGNLVELWEPARTWSAEPRYVQSLEDEAPESPTRRRPARWVPVIMAAVIITVFVVVVNREGDPPASTGPPPTPPTASTTAMPLPAKPAVTEVGRPLLGVKADWELFAYRSGEVVRIELARGRVTRTPVPILNSSGPFSFIVGPDLALIRPMDNVPGYVVPDGRPAEALTGKLSHAGLQFPGPEPDQVWVTSADEEQVMSLVTMDGADTGQSISLPPDIWPHASDGRGNLIGSGIGGEYLIEPGTLRRITTGVLTAVGPTRFLTLECDKNARCASVVVDRLTGALRALDVEVDRGYSPRGTISPDGSHAAILRSGSVLHLIDLDTGADHALGIEVDIGGHGGPSMVWSPDSRWLFVPSNRRLMAVETAKLRARELGVTLRHLNHIAIRPG